MFSGLYWINQTETNISRMVENCSTPCNGPPSVWDYSNGVLGFTLQALAVAMLVANVPVIYFRNKAMTKKEPPFDRP